MARQAVALMARACRTRELLLLVREQEPSDEPIQFNPADGPKQLLDVIHHLVVPFP